MSRSQRGENWNFKTTLCSLFFVKEKNTWQCPSDAYTIPNVSRRADKFSKSSKSAFWIEREREASYQVATLVKLIDREAVLRAAQFGKTFSPALISLFVRVGLYINSKFPS